MRHVVNNWLAEKSDPNPMNPSHCRFVETAANLAGLSPADIWAFPYQMEVREARHDYKVNVVHLAEEMASVLADENAPEYAKAAARAFLVELARERSL